jgi:polyisoprenoid-binding protein YceI
MKLTRQSSRRKQPMSTAITTPNLEELTGTYVLDPAHSRIGFVARHAMVTKVRGSFREFEGRAQLDADDPSRSRFELTIHVTRTCARTTSSTRRPTPRSGSSRRPSRRPGPTPTR